MPQRKHTLVEGRRVSPAGHVLLIGLIFLGLGALLNAASLLKTAEGQTLGSPLRAVAVGVMDPVAEISGLLLLDRPRQLLDRALGDAPPAEVPTDGVVAGPPATILHPEGWDPADSTTTTGVETPTTTQAPSELRTISADEPLKLWIIGDSFVELFGKALLDDAADTGVVEAERHFEFTSGLVRSDFFDWPEYIAEQLPEVQPEAVVVMFGGNDGQPLTWDGEVLEPDTPEWLEVYHVLVGEAMDVLLTGTTRVYWVGLPIMEDDRFTQRVIGFNTVYQEEAANRPGVVYVDIFDLFADENGEFATYLHTSSGQLQDMRMPDGAHFTWNGAYRLSWFVLNMIAEDWDFTDHL